MSKEDIETTQGEFVQAAINARSVGFDGIEIHAGNGYLFDQFHHSNSK
jgi:N-ethylmaleimide reductase